MAGTSQPKPAFGTYVSPPDASDPYHDIESQQTTQRGLAGGWPEAQADLPCSELPPEIRNGFIRKVLSILTLQVLTTLAVSTLFMLTPNVRETVLSTRWAFYVAIFAPIGFLLALGCYQQSHPTNMFLLSGFTLAESYTVGFVCAATYASGNSAIIWQALLITAAVFISLVTFVLVTRRDFSQHGLLLFGLLLALVVAGLFVPFFGPTAHLIYACAGALLFTGMVLYDMSLLVHRFGPDDYIMAAIALCVLLELWLRRYLAALRGALPSCRPGADSQFSVLTPSVVLPHLRRYLDVLNLFLYILQILQMFTNGGRS
jgi:hypothetical protein